MEGQRRMCSASTVHGAPCRMRPLRGEERCLSHHPDYAEKAAEARRLGGMRRRHEKAVATSYNITTLESPSTSDGSRRSPRWMHSSSRTPSRGLGC
jgi:hypothetical protein